MNDKTGRKHVRLPMIVYIRHPYIILELGFPAAPPYCRNGVVPTVSHLEEPTSLITTANNLRLTAV